MYVAELADVAGHLVRLAALAGFAQRQEEYRDQHGAMMPA